MGHEERERRRLALQGSILNPLTEELLRRSGVSGGMHVLDLGCGIGDVSLIASRLVGNQGHVTAIDIDPAALNTAQQRAQEQGRANISFVQSAIEEYHPEQLFDAVTARHILIHTPDPLNLLCGARQMLREGGVAVLQEYDFSVIHPGYPPCPLRDDLVRISRDFFCKAVQGDIGSRLYHLFVEAGFPAPDCRVEYPIGGGPDSLFYDWIAESMRTIFPRFEAVGLTPPNHLNLDTLAQQLREEAMKQNASVPAPPMIGGFARKR